MLVHAWLAMLKSWLVSLLIMDKYLHLSIRKLFWLNLLFMVVELVQWARAPLGNGNDILMGGLHGVWWAGCTVFYSLIVATWKFVNTGQMFALCGGHDDAFVVDLTAILATSYRISTRVSAWEHLHMYCKNTKPTAVSGKPHPQLNCG